MITLHVHRPSIHPPHANVNVTTLHLAGHTGHPRTALRAHRALPTPGVPRDDMTKSPPRLPTVPRLLLMILTHRHPLLLPPRHHTGTALSTASLPRLPTALRLLLIIMTHRRPLLLPPRRHVGTALSAASLPRLPTVLRLLLMIMTHHHPLLLPSRRHAGTTLPAASLPRLPTVPRLLLMIMTHRHPHPLPPRHHAGTALPDAPELKYYNNGYWISPPLLWPFPLLL
jgi:hypothetical protein